MDRKAEQIIYARFHGNDVKRLCKAITDIAATSLSPESGQVVRALMDFDHWARAVSTINTIQIRK